jgi:hypothetical protein
VDAAIEAMPDLQFIAVVLTRTFGTARTNGPRNETSAWRVLAN